MMHLFNVIIRSFYSILEESLDMFKVRSKITLKDTDAAGIIFFSNILVKAHEAYEELLEEIGINLNEAIRKNDYLIPIVHAEADYRSTLVQGDSVIISVFVENIGESSFCLKYDFTIEHNKILAANARTVHACISKQTRAKIPIPDSLKSKLIAFQ